MTAGSTSALGIENTFVPQERPGERAIDEYELTEHYERWHDDLALAQSASARSSSVGASRGIGSARRRASGTGSGPTVSWRASASSAFARSSTCCTTARRSGSTTSSCIPTTRSMSPSSRHAAAERYSDVVDRLDARQRADDPRAVLRRVRLLAPVSAAAQPASWPMSAALARGFVETQRGIADVQADATFVHVDASLRYVGDVDARGAPLARPSDSARRPSSSRTSSPAGSAATIPWRLWSPHMASAMTSLPGSPSAPSHLMSWG